MPDKLQTRETMLTGEDRQSSMPDTTELAAQKDGGIKDARETLRRISRATPGNTNSRTADDMRSWCKAVADCCLDRIEAARTVARPAEVGEEPGRRLSLDAPAATSTTPRLEETQVTGDRLALGVPSQNDSVDAEDSTHAVRVSTAEEEAASFQRAWLETEAKLAALAQRVAPDGSCSHD